LNAKLPLDPKVDHIGLHEVNHDILKRRNSCSFINLIEFNIGLFNYLKLINFLISRYETVGLNGKIVDPHPLFFVLDEISLEKEDLLTRLCDEYLMLEHYCITEC
jgi:hypothetical protein